MVQTVQQVVADLQRRQHAVVERCPEVEDEVAVLGAEHGQGTGQEVRLDQLGLLRPQRRGEGHEARRVWQHRSEQELPEGSLVGRVRHPRQAARRGEVRQQRNVVVGKREVDQQHLAGVPPAELGGQVEREGGTARAALGRVNRDLGCV